MQPPMRTLGFSGENSIDEISTGVYRAHYALITCTSEKLRMRT